MKHILTKTCILRNCEYLLEHEALLESVINSLLYFVCDFQIISSYNSGNSVLLL